jgi:hypothetical protein
LSTARRALVDLFVVRFAGLEFGGRNVEGDGAGAEAEGIQVGVGVVDRGLEVSAKRGEFASSRDGGAVDDLDAGVVGVGVLVGEDGVADDPVIVGALGGAGGPLVEAPVAGDAGAGVDLAVAEVAQPAAASSW